MTTHEESPLADFRRESRHIDGDIAQIEYWSGSVQISSCQGPDLSGQASLDDRSGILVAKQGVPIKEKKSEVGAAKGAPPRLITPPQHALQRYDPDTQEPRQTDNQPYAADVQ